jgi:hypothetical protein
MSKRTERESRESFDAKKFRERVLEEMQKFNISKVRDEDHLRMLIMDRVLESTERFFTVSENGGEEVLLRDLPEDKKGERLNDLLQKILGDIQGPGPMLRRLVAMLILHYRMWLRLRELLPTLAPSAPERKNIEKGVRHIETTFFIWMLLVYLWPTNRDDKWSEELTGAKWMFTRELQENREDPAVQPH